MKPVFIIILLIALILQAPEIFGQGRPDFQQKETLNNKNDSDALAIALREKIEIEKISDSVSRLGKVEIDTKSRMVRFPGRIMAETPEMIELIACLPLGKTYEAFIVADVKAIHLQIAMLLLGLQPGKNPAINYSFDDPMRDRPDGSPARVYVEWQPGTDGSDGEKPKRRRERVEWFLKDIASGEPLPLSDFIFMGSLWLKAGFAADFEGTLIALYRDPGSILELAHARAGEIPWSAVIKERTPPTGTEVDVVILALSPSETTVKKTETAQKAEVKTGEPDKIKPEQDGVFFEHAQKPERSDSLLLESRANVRLALQWLAKQQEQNGSWHDMPAITALIVRGMLRSDIEEFDVKSEPVRRGLEYIRLAARDDGGIYTSGYANYNTALSAMALAEAGLEEDEHILWKAREYLLGLQAVENQSFNTDDWMYGGWGYEPHAAREGMHTADMSNTHLTIEALIELQKLARERGWKKWMEPQVESKKDPVDQALKKAVIFLSRSQNLRETNPLPRTGNDGGFRYRPHETRADGQKDDEPLRSYASISYAGAKSLVFAGLTKDDPRVRAVAEYIRRNWTVRENPGLGRQSLYYYYMTMSRCLHEYQVEIIVTPLGTRHDWRKELVKQLLSLQEHDSAWRNDEARWMERLPELTTAYAVLAMTYAWENW